MPALELPVKTQGTHTIDKFEARKYDAKVRRFYGAKMTNTNYGLTSQCHSSKSGDGIGFNPVERRC